MYVLVLLFLVFLVCLMVCFILSLKLLVMYLGGSRLSFCICRTRCVYFVSLFVVCCCIDALP